MQELSCTWVPGTLDVVRVRLRPGRPAQTASAGSAAAPSSTTTTTIELTSTRLARIFGPRALDDLYLKGRATVQASPQQLAALT
ncbi:MULTISPECIES: hypothetical protein [Deinococcus]|uniref:hypothetical protein n=1 Tax=Deinococcus TaxID=1298 RepID=UPI0004812DB7|nr:MULTISPECIES: hypothetical protein [Deinococcus]KEF33834.1 hypothetical protein RDMS_10235 [Deinococcus sp. RL]